MVLLIISFVAGVLTVLAPCILPLLPVIIGGSLSGETAGYNVKKALTIVLSLGASVVLFTLVLKVSTLFVNIPENVWKGISGGIIVLLGLLTLFPNLWETKWMARLNTKSNILLGKGAMKKSLWGDIIIGAALGPVFSSCSPTYFIVVATVLPARPVVGLAYLIAYTIGLCISLFVISLVGQRIMAKLEIAVDPHSWLKRGLGILFIIVGIAIIGGLDKSLQLYILNAGFFDVTKVEQRLLRERVAEPPSYPETPIGNKSQSDFPSLAEKEKMYERVPELSSIDGYINTNGKPITLASLRGKVVLLDIWTYSCINCQRTIPYIVNWYSKYKDQGLEVVGLHTPEFSFEKVQANVEKAVASFGIKYPVVMDNDYSTWQALGNQFWPRKYLVDIDGFIVYDHIGEGDYDVTEMAIQRALAERAERLGVTASSTRLETPSNVVAFDPSKVGSAETYFGSARNNGIGNLSLSLSGPWDLTPEYAENTGPASITYKFNSKNVYMAAGADASLARDGIDIEIYLDDALYRKINIKDQTLYTIIEGKDYGEHKLKIVVPGAGLQAFTFTFG